MEFGVFGGRFDKFPINTPNNYGFAETQLVGNYSNLRSAISPLAWGNKIYMICDENSNTNPFYNKMVIYDIDTGNYSIDDFPFQGSTSSDGTIPGDKPGRFHYLSSVFAKGVVPTSIPKIDLQTKTKTTISNIPSTVFGGNSKMCYGETDFYTTAITTATGTVGGTTKITFKIYKYSFDTNISTTIDTFIYDGDFGDSNTVAAMTHIGNNIFYITISHTVISTTPKLTKVYVLKYDANNGNKEIINMTIPKTGIIDNLFSIDNSNLWDAYYSVFKDNKIYYRGRLGRPSADISDNTLMNSVYDLSNNIYTTLTVNHGVYTGYNWGIIETEDYLITNDSVRSGTFGINLLQLV